MERVVDEWGRVLLDSDDAIEMLFRGQDITQLCILPSSEIDVYNAICTDRDKLNFLIEDFSEPGLSPEQDTERRKNTWLIPEEYQQMNIREVLLNLCERPDEIERVNMEMAMFEQRGLEPVLKLMHFLVEHWRQNGVVWGVGRGSSVASYCLFLLGVHKLDAIRYNFDIKEFLK